MRRKVLVAVATLLFLLASAGAAGAISLGPAYAGDFPDPFVLRAGDSYWAYSTGSAGRNLQAMNSADLRTWSAPVDPLPVLPGWARTGLTWAPGVIAQAGGYLMYYTVRDAASARQCVSVAASPIPAGPFVDTSSAPLVCQLPNGGSIDPSPFRAANGTTYLLWKSDDNALGRRTQLWGQQLGNDGRAVVGPRVVLLAQSQSWQAPVIEGPSMVAAGGLYYLFYGAGAWDSAGAAIGYARCLSPLGPCVNASVSGPWMASHGKAIGPSGPEVFIDATGAPRLAYHAWTGPVGYQDGGSRSLWIDTLRFSGVTPAVT